MHHARRLRRTLVFLVLVFAGIFWAISNVRYFDELMGEPSAMDLQQPTGAPILANIR